MMSAATALVLATLTATDAVRYPRLHVATSIGAVPLLVALLLWLRPAVEPSAAWLGLLLALLAIVLRRPALQSWPFRLLAMAFLALVVTLIGRETAAAAVALASPLPSAAVPWIAAACVAGWIALGTVLAKPLAGCGFPWEFGGLHAAAAAMLVERLNEAPAMPVAAEAAAAVCVVAGLRTGRMLAFAGGLAVATVFLRIGA